MLKRITLYFLFQSFFVLSYAQTYHQVADMAPGTSSMNYGFTLGVVNGKSLLYLFNESNNNNEIWMTDGTEANTELLLSTNNSGFENIVNQYFIANNNIYFRSSFEGTVFRFDGEALHAVVSGVAVYRMTWFENDLYFLETSLSFNTGLYKATSDPMSPEFIYDLGDPNMQGITVYNGQMIIMGQADGMTQLFTSDGTAAGTSPFVELGNWSNANWAEQFTEHNGILYFYYQSNNVFASVPIGFYRTDGTAAGTIRLADTYNTDSWFVWPQERKSLWDNGTLYSAGRPGLLGGSNDLHELWTSDGTVAGTNELLDLNGPDESSSPRYFVKYNNEIYFMALKSNGEKAIWKTDGTIAGTFPILTSLFSDDDSYYGDWLTVYDGKLAFGAYTPETGSELWFSDGTEAGTMAITEESDEDENLYQPRRFYVKNNLLFYTARTTEFGRELWVYDNGLQSSISTVITNITCDDNDTPSVLEDDFVTITLNASGTNTGANYSMISSAGIPSPAQGDYGQDITFVFPEGSAGNGDITVTVTDDADPTIVLQEDFSDPGTCSTTSTKASSDSVVKVSISPNPFQEELYITIENPEGQKDFIFEIIDLRGQSIYEKVISENSIIHIPEDRVIPGLYFYTLREVVSGNIVRTAKLMKK